MRSVVVGSAEVSTVTSEKKNFEKKIKERREICKMIKQISEHQLGVSGVCGLEVKVCSLKPSKTIQLRTCCK